MSKQKKIALSAAGFFIFLILFSITILPILVKNKAIEAIQQACGRKTRLESVSINPFTLTVTVKGFAVEEPGGAPLIGIGSVRASLSPASIYRRALILSEVAIDSPSLNITRTAPNRYNFSDILDRQKKENKPKSEGEAHFSINNITIRNGSGDINDKAVEGGRRHTIRNLEIGIPFISNIPYLLEKYTDPKLSAVVNGAQFSFGGKLKPFSKSMSTEVHIGLSQLDLPGLVAYSPIKPTVDLASGSLTIDSDLSYLVSADKKPELSIRGMVRLDNIAVNLDKEQPLIRLPLLEVNSNRLDLMAKRFNFGAIKLNGLELFVSRDSRGAWMYERLLPKAGPDASAAKEKAKPASPTDKNQPLVQVSSLDLTNSTLHIVDAEPRGGFKSSLNEIDFSIRNFSNAVDKNAEFELSLLVDKATGLQSSGTFSVNPLAIKSSTELSDLKLQLGWPYLSRFLTAPLNGLLGLSCDLSFSRDKGLIAENGSLTLKNLSTRYGVKEGLELALLEIKGAAFNQMENRLEIGGIMLSKGNVSLSREVDGSISLLSLLKREAAGTAKTAPSRRPIANATKTDRDSRKAPPLSYRLKQFQTDRLNIAFTDKTLEAKPRFTLRDTRVSLANLNGPKFTPAQLRFNATLDRNTLLKANGDITPLPFRYRGDLTLGRLDFRDFAEYIPDNLNVAILGGYLDTALKVDVALKEGKPSGAFRGKAGIRSFHAVDSAAEEDLLKWESLQLDEIQGRLEPFSLAIRQIALNGVYSRIIVRKDGTLNLQNLVDKPAPVPAAEAALPAPVPASPKPAPAAAASPGPTKSASPKGLISIGAVTIQGGTLAFSDNHLPQQFSTTFYNLGGRVSGLSSEETRFADVDLRGNLENHSPLQITGTVNPLRDDLFVDLKVAFSDIELSPVTPYSGTYLGYSVEKGKLSLDLKYHIEKKELRSENRIFIDQFTFGKQVESAQATKLPVRLGLALLKDRKGEIHLDVPVTGRTDDPKFSIWRLVWQVLRNLLVKAATSPFALLSSMFGDGADLSTIQYTQGTSALTPAEEQKLTALAKALSDRPALKIELKGYVDREKDTEGYRAELLNRKVAGEKLLSLAKKGQGSPDQKSAPVTVLPDEYSRYLKAVYKKEKFPKPRNALGLVKDLPDAEMKKLIITNTVVGDSELQSLAQERSAAVMDYLVKKGGVAAERIFLKKDNIHKPPEKEGSGKSRVELNAIAQ
jgi:hypothetical protein